MSKRLSTAGTQHSDGDADSMEQAMSFIERWQQFFADARDQDANMGELELRLKPILASDLVWAKRLVFWTVRHSSNDFRAVKHAKLRVGDALRELEFAFDAVRDEAVGAGSFQDFDRVADKHWELRRQWYDTLRIQDPRVRRFPHTEVLVPDEVWLVADTGCLVPRILTYALHDLKEARELGFSRSFDSRTMQFAAYYQEALKRIHIAPPQADEESPSALAERIPELHELARDFKNLEICQAFHTVSISEQHDVFIDGVRERSREISRSLLVFASFLNAQTDVQVTFERDDFVSRYFGKERTDAGGLFGNLMSGLRAHLPRLRITSPRGPKTVRGLVFTAIPADFRRAWDDF